MGLQSGLEIRKGQGLAPIAPVFMIPSVNEQGLYEQQHNLHTQDAYTFSHSWIPAGLGGAPLRRAQKAQNQNRCSFMFADYTPQNF